MVERLKAMLEGLHARRRVWLAQNPGLEAELSAAGELIWPDERDLYELVRAYESRTGPREVLARIEGEIAACEWLLALVEENNGEQL